jgi:photosystem II stability/assembly factor-like uncharacterized protein
VVTTDTNAPLFGVGCHAETKVCIAYGGEGVILRSTDYGKHFVRTPIGATSELRAMDYALVRDVANGPGKIGPIIVGEQGAVYVSRDDGASFVREPSGSLAFLGHVVLVPTEGVWLAAGEHGTVVRSTGNGQWNKIAFPSDRLITSLHASALGHVFAADDGGNLFRSTDGGQSFRLIRGPAPEAFITDLASDSTGKRLLATTRDDEVLRSTDGGEHFEAVSLGTKSYLSHVTSLGTKGFLIVGNDGVLLRASADLTTFRRILLLNAGALEASNFEPDTGAWVVVGKGGFIASSTHLEVAPTTRSPALLRHMNAVVFEPKRAALVAVGTDEGAMRSIDGGKSWQNVNLPVADGTTMFSIAVSEKTGTLVASGTGAALLRSTDGGAHFVATRGVTGSLSTVYAASDGSFLTAPVDEGVLRSVDDGKTWVPSKIDPGISIVNFIATKSGLVAFGLKGALFYSTDRGQSFVRSSSDNMADLRAIAVTPKAIVVVGGAGTILRSTDEGRSFSVVATGTDANLLCIAFHPAAAALIAVGNDGTILTSFDDGERWSKVSSGVTERLRLTFYDPETSQIAVIGHQGALLVSADGNRFTQYTNHTRSKLGAFVYHPPTRQFLLVGERLVGLRLRPKEDLPRL